MTAPADIIQIMVVDDDRDTLRLIAHHLRQHFDGTVQVFEEQDPTAAAELAKNHQIDIVVTDLDMTDVNGFHLLKIVKSKDPLTQVVILTAHDSLNAIRSAFTMGADEFITKPVQPKDLFETVDYLSRRLARWKSTLTV